MDRVVVYIDGFNLYFGLCEKGWRRYLWLDLAQLAARLLGPGQMLAGAKYFTSRVRADPGKVRRQATYLQVLEARGGVSIYYDRYQHKTRQCRNCNAIWGEYEEKMSDVRLAVELVKDAYTNAFDTAVVVSADADLQPPLELLRQSFREKRVVAVFPPARESHVLRAIAHESFRIGRARLSKSQLPRVVAKPDGFLLHRPGEWY